MAFAKIEIGNIRLTALLDGDHELGGSLHDMFPDAPEDELLAYATRYPGLAGDNGGWQLHVRGWLVEHPGGVLLMDTGVGGAASPAMAWFPAPGVLPDALHEVGVPPSAISVVAISHVHDDHIGGTVDAAGAPMFPNARYLVPSADLAWLKAEAPKDDEARALLTQLLDPISSAGMLDEVDGDVDLADGIQLHPMPGHTPGHQVLRIQSKGKRAIVSADTFNHPAQLSHPDWPSGPDNDPGRAATSRRALIAELASHPGTIVAPTHLAEAFGAVKTGPDGLAGWVPAG